MPGENIYDWSITAADNATADSAINWAEGQLLASINNSARSEMAAHAKLRNLQNGSIVTAGTVNAQTFSSGLSFTTPPPAGMRVLLKVGDLTNTGAMTLNMDGTGPISVKTPAGDELATGTVGRGDYIQLLYDGTNWVFLSPLPPDVSIVLPGMFLLATATASNSATIDFAADVGDRYHEYLVVLTEVKPSTNGTALYVRMSTDGGATYLAGAASYAFVRAGMENSAITALSDEADNQIIMSSASLTTTTASAASGEVRIFTPASTSGTRINFKLNYRTAAAQAQRWGTGFCNAGAAVNGIRFVMSTGTIASGTFQLYALENQLDIVPITNAFLALTPRNIGTPGPFG